ncbi:MAG: hypothetical protein M1813_003695 [Trichoglossum hirsutum]|nr:MAG: hypothetical protein M1813_003695 [Trichoglossum hirsutum]
MADPLGLSLASASIASAQVVSSLRTISSAYFKFMVSTDANSKQDIHNYEITLRRLDTLLRVLESESSSQIPMHLLEESYRELRIQMALLESLANEASKSKSKFVVKLRWTIREKRRLEHFAARLDHFIKLFEASLSLHRLQSIKMLSDLEAISHASEK